MLDKLAAAKAYLGEAWVLHPRYDPQKHPAHQTKAPYVLRSVLGEAQAAARI